MHAEQQVLQLGTLQFLSNIREENVVRAALRRNLLSFYHRTHLRFDSDAVRFLEVQFEPALAVVTRSSQLGELVTPRDLSDSLVGQRESLSPLQCQTGGSAVECYWKGFALRQETERYIRERYFTVVQIQQITYLPLNA